MKIAIVGRGKAGHAFALALRDVGHDVLHVAHDDLADVGAASVILLAVPDDVLGDISRALVIPPSVVVAHLAGSRSAEVLVDHPLRGVLHPLVPLTGDAHDAAARLRGATFSVAGDRLLVEIAHSLDGRVLEISDEQRVAYHAAACVAANHLVALMASVEAIAAAAQLSLADFLPLARMALDDVAARGPQAALTGPAARGDLDTLARHLAVLPLSERAAYEALSARARVLAGVSAPCES
jgi:predicted short-subunit dehydrogenase-like oxidoreductase (DUF2520 family)